MSALPLPQQNHLLAALSAEVLDRLYPLILNLYRCRLARFCMRQGIPCDMSIFLPTPSYRCSM